MRQNAGINSLSRQNVLSNLTAFLVGGTASKLFSAAALFLIARQIGPTSFGLYAPALATAVLTSIFFSLGLDNWILYKGGRDHSSIEVIVSSALSIRVGLGILWLVLYSFAGRWLNAETFPQDLLFWAAVSIYLELVGDVVLSSYRAILRNDLATIFGLVFHLGFFVAVLLLQGFGRTDALVYIQARATFALISLIASLLWFLKAHTLRFSWRAVKLAINETSVFAISMGLATIYARADLTIVAQFLGGSASAQYSPASSLVNALFVFPAAGYTVLIPVLGQAQKNDLGNLKKVAFWAIALAVIAGIVSGVVIMVTATPFVTIAFGSAYRASGALISILAWVFAFKCVSFAFAAILVAVGRQRHRIWTQFVATVFNVSLNILLINRLGLVSVAWIYVFTELIITLGYGFQVHKWWQTSDGRDTNSNSADEYTAD